MPELRSGYSGNREYKGAFGFGGDMMSRGERGKKAVKSLGLRLIGVMVGFILAMWLLDIMEEIDE